MAVPLSLLLLQTVRKTPLRLLPAVGAAFFLRHRFLARTLPLARKSPPAIAVAPAAKEQPATPPDKPRSLTPARDSPTDSASTVSASTVGSVSTASTARPPARAAPPEASPSSLARPVTRVAASPLPPPAASPVPSRLRTPARAGEACDRELGCRGSPAVNDGLTPADWIASLDEERREVEAGWAATLTAEQFRVLRMKGTEPIHSGRYNETTADGVYECAACATPLFLASHKFQSGHGWPAFSDNVENALVRIGTRKVEIVCAGCEGHVGHVFKSSRYPPPKRERHCVNSVSLRFIPSGKSLD